MKYKTPISIKVTPSNQAVRAPTEAGREMKNCRRAKCNTIKIHQMHTSTQDYVEVILGENMTLGTINTVCVKNHTIISQLSKTDVVVMPEKSNIKVVIPRTL